MESVVSATCTPVKRQNIEIRRARFFHKLGLRPYDVVCFVAKLLARLSASELPIDGGAMTIHSPIPGFGFATQVPQRADASLAYALPGEQVDFDLRAAATALVPLCSFIGLAADSAMLFADIPPHASSVTKPH
jgi:hypothetical protein